MRKRARELGIKIGNFKPGKYNSITDVKGVLVGHHTLNSGSTGKGPVIRTGVTAILPNDDIFFKRVAGGSFILNGAGEVSGLTQLTEWGIIETPIMLTNTMSVGAVSSGVGKFMAKKHPGIGGAHDVVIPLVGECDDSWLNDITGFHIKSEHVTKALQNAKTGNVAEGCVGGGTGMITCDFKSGIGTSSRKLSKEQGGHTIGVMVMSNFGRMEDLRVDGVNVGKVFDNQYKEQLKRKVNYGSIIVVVATDAPLFGSQLNRLAKRASLALGRMGSYAAHGSGEIILAFSTTNIFQRNSPKQFHSIKILTEGNLNPLYQAVIEATEEAVLNSMCMATDTYGRNNTFSPAIPQDELVKLYNKGLL